MTDYQQSVPAPLLSIVIPSFNQGRYIAETLRSVLGQDYRPIEILVIDGGSTDETIDVLNGITSPELRWWSERDRGVVEAVNKGFSRARGALVAIQSSDDVYVAGAFSKAVAALTDNPLIALVYGEIEFIDERSMPFGRSSQVGFDLLAYIGKQIYIPQPAAFFRASAQRTAGPWREDISYAADAEFFLRIAERHAVLKLDEVLAQYRYHSAQRDKESVKVPRDWQLAMRPYAASADANVRRAARSGIWRVYHHYTPQQQFLKRALYAWRMVIEDPSLLHEEGRIHDLFPLKYAARLIGSRVKRALRRKKR